jgi:uncharacterized C2H2 Zn-finger protein
MIRFVKQLYSAWQHDRKLTEHIVRQHFLEGCPRCKLIFQQTKDWRLVDAVANKHLKTHVIWLCPSGRGRPQQFNSILDTPATIECSCGESHETSMDDIEIAFIVV